MARAMSGGTPGPILKAMCDGAQPRAMVRLYVFATELCIALESGVAGRQLLEYYVFMFCFFFLQIDVGSMTDPML